MNMQEPSAIRELTTDEVDATAGGVISFQFFNLDFAFEKDIAVVKDHATGDVYLWLP